MRGAPARGPMSAAEDISDAVSDPALLEALDSNGVHSLEQLAALQPQSAETLAVSCDVSTRLVLSAVEAAKGSLKRRRNSTDDDSDHGRPKRARQRPVDYWTAAGASEGADRQRAAAQSAKKILKTRPNGRGRPRKSSRVVPGAKPNEGMRRQLMQLATTASAARVGRPPPPYPPAPPAAHQVPEWASDTTLTEALRDPMQFVDPDEIFGPVQTPCNLQGKKAVSASLS